MKTRFLQYTGWFKKFIQIFSRKKENMENLDESQYTRRLNKVIRISRREKKARREFGEKNRFPKYSGRFIKIMYIIWKRDENGEENLDSKLIFTIYRETYKYY